MRYKTKYQMLSKEEKKKLRDKFYATEHGKTARGRLDRLLLYAIIGYPFSIYLFVTEKSIPNIIIGVILLIASTIYLIASYKIRLKEFNNFLIK